MITAFGAWSLIIGVIAGVLIGLCTKGITVNIIHKQDVDKTPSDTDYNSSYGIPEVKQYLDNQYKVGDE